MSTTSCNAANMAVAASAAALAAICIMSDDGDKRTFYSQNNRESHCLGTDSIKDKIKYLKEEREVFLKVLDHNNKALNDLKAGKFLPKLEEAVVKLKKSAIRYLSIGTILMLSGLPVWINISKYVDVDNFALGPIVIALAASVGIAGIACITEGIGKLKERSNTEECIEDYKDYLEDNDIDVEDLNLDEETLKEKMKYLKQKDTLLREKLSLITDKSERFIVRKQIIDNYNEYMKYYRRLYPEDKINSDYKLVLK